MPRAIAAQVAAPGSTARPAEKGTDSQFDPALRRLGVDAVCRWSAANGRPMRRREAREWVDEHYGHAPDELEAWLRQTYRSDPTGVTAVRNVARGDGHG